MSQETPKEGQSALQTTSDIEFSYLKRFRDAVNELVLTPFLIIIDDWRSRIGLAILVSFGLMGTVGVYLVEPPGYAGGPRYLFPLQNLEFPLGTDGSGQGLFSMIVHGTPPMLEMVIGGAVFSVTVATIIGTLSGFKGGNIDTILMTFTDIAMTVPGLPLVIVIISIVEPRSAFLIGILLSINAWAGLARTIRSQVLAMRQESYIEASRVTGMSTTYILTRDITPPLMPYISINFMEAARGVIFGAVGLYFIGLLPYSEANWGVMLNNAYGLGVLDDPRRMMYLFVPLVTIILFSLGLILLAQGMDKIFNPRIRARHSDSDDDHEEIGEESAASIPGGKMT